MEPFGLSEELGPDEVREIRKRELSNLLTSYADEADVFSEIIQNAFDAIELAASRGLEFPPNTPQLEIFVGRRSGDEHYFAVVDRGIGMPPEIANRFSIPGWGAHKERGTTIGHKGIGASFVIAATNRFAMSSSNDEGERTEMTISNAYTWIKNQTAPSPTVSDHAELPDPVRSAVDGRGTAICVYFHDGMSPSRLSWIVSVEDGDPEKELGNWASYLCLKSSLGRSAPTVTKDFKVRFHLDRGSGNVSSSDWVFSSNFSRNLKQLAYPHPNDVLSVAEPATTIEKIPDISRHLHRNKYQAISFEFSKKDIEAIDFSEKERQVIGEHFEGVKLYYAYSVGLFDEIRGRLGNREFRYGMKLLVDGVPQGRMVDFSLTRNQGLDRQMHATISFKGLELDSGRKIPSNENVASAIQKIGTYVAGQASDFKFFIRKKEVPHKPSDLSNWQKEIIERRKDSLVVDLFERKNVVAPLYADPYSESDVIALTSGMISAGLLKGLKPYSLSSSTIYDCLADVVTDGAELSIHDDPLSIRTKSVGRSRELGAVEYKFVFESVIDDFLNEVKRANEIDLLICWDVGSLNVARGQLDFWYGPKADRREVYGATHVWTDENLATSIPVISLKHAVCILLAQAEAKSDEKGLGTVRLADLLDRDQKDLL